MLLNTNKKSKFSSTLNEWILLYGNENEKIITTSTLKNPCKSNTE